MKLELEVLDGRNRGRRLTLRNGLLLGKEQGGIPFDDKEMASSHAVITFDKKNMWNIECLAPNMMRLGFEEVARAALIKGLIFHLGQTGFKVVERAPTKIDSWKNEIKTWLDEAPARPESTDIQFFLKPIRLNFIQGPQFEEFYTLSYGPRVLGYNNLDLNLKDPSSPAQVVRFFQVADQSYIESLCGDAVTINNEPFVQRPLSDGDVLRITSSVIELSFLYDDK